MREVLCRALVNGGLGVLELRRNDRELESVFLRLAGAGSPAMPAGDKATSADTKAKDTKEAEVDDGDSALEHGGSTRA